MRTIDEMITETNGEPTLEQRLQEAVDYLTEHPDEIPRAWGLSDCDKEWYGILFQFVTPDGRSRADETTDRVCGCLTQIRDGFGVAFNDPELTELIRNDTRIPRCPRRINPEDLLVFKEWQLKIAKRYGRELSPWTQ